PLDLHYTPSYHTYELLYPFILVARLQPTLPLFPYTTLFRSQPETSTSTPATPPLIAATRPSSVPKRTSFLTWLRKMIKVIGMVGPAIPCSARANMSTPILGASAAMTPPRAMTESMMSKILRRPRISERRGRKSPHIAPPVKKA